MTANRYAFAIALSAALLPPTVVWAQGEEPAPPTVRGALESATVLLGMGQAEEALEVLVLVEREEPENPWLWYDRGSAYAQLGEPYEALAAFDRAAEILAELGDPDPNLADSIARLRAVARRQVFGFSIRSGFAYDTNVSFLGAGASALGLIAGRPDAKVNFQAQVDFAPVANRRATLALGLRTSQVRHFAIEQFDWQNYGGYVRYARRWGRSWEASVRYDVDASRLNNDSYLSQQVFSPRLTYRWPVRSSRFRFDETSVYYRLEARDFLFATDPELDQDGLVQAVGMEQRLSVQPLIDFDWVLDVDLGYVYQRVRTEGTEFDRRVNEFFLSVSAPLVRPDDPQAYLLFPDKPLRLSFQARWELANYVNASRFDRHDRKRRDLTTMLGITLSQTLREDPRWGDIILHVIIHWTDADSTVLTEDFVAPFSYDKLVYGVQVQWSW